MSILKVEPKEISEFCKCVTTADPRLGIDFVTVKALISHKSQLDISLSSITDEGIKPE